MSKLHIKKGDTVYVNSGEDKGKTAVSYTHLDVYKRQTEWCRSRN